MQLIKFFSKDVMSLKLSSDNISVIVQDTPMLHQLLPLHFSSPTIGRYIKAYSQDESYFRFREWLAQRWE